MNSGVFCFERAAAGIAFAEGLIEYYLRRREHLGIGLHRGVRAQTDEIYLGLWMGLNGLDPVADSGGGCGRDYRQTDFFVSWRQTVPF